MIIQFFVVIYCNFQISVICLAPHGVLNGYLYGHLVGNAGAVMRQPAVYLSVSDDPGVCLNRPERLDQKLICFFFFVFRC